MWQDVYRNSDDLQPIRLNWRSIVPLWR